MASLATKGCDQVLWCQMQTGKVQVEYRGLPLLGPALPQAQRVNHDESNPVRVVPFHFLVSGSGMGM